MSRVTGRETMMSRRDTMMTDASGWNADIHDIENESDYGFNDDDNDWRYSWDGDSEHEKTMKSIKTMDDLEGAMKKKFSRGETFEYNKDDNMCKGWSIEKTFSSWSGIGRDKHK